MSSLQNLALVYKAKVALVGLIVKPESTQLRTISIIKDGRLLENMVCPLPGSVSEAIVNTGKVILSDSAAKYYPADTML